MNIRYAPFTLSTYFAFVIKQGSDDPVGPPITLPTNQLPTNGDVIRHWRKVRQLMEREQPGRRVANVTVAKRVMISRILELTKEKPGRIHISSRTVENAGPAYSNIYR